MSKILRYLKFLEEITGDKFYLDLDTDVSGRVYWYKENGDDQTLFSFSSQQDLSAKLNQNIKEMM